MDLERGSKAKDLEESRHPCEDVHPDFEVCDICFALIAGNQMKNHIRMNHGDTDIKQQTAIKNDCKPPSDESQPTSSSSQSHIAAMTEMEVQEIPVNEVSLQIVPPNPILDMEMKAKVEIKLEASTSNIGDSLLTVNDHSDSANENSEMGVEESKEVLPTLKLETLQPISSSSGSAEFEDDLVSEVDAADIEIEVSTTDARETYEEDMELESFSDHSCYGPDCQLTGCTCMVTTEGSSEEDDDTMAGGNASSLSTFLDTNSKSDTDDDNIKRESSVDPNVGDHSLFECQISPIKAQNELQDNFPSEYNSTNEPTPIQEDSTQENTCCSIIEKVEPGLEIVQSVQVDVSESVEDVENIEIKTENVANSTTSSTTCAEEESCSESATTLDEEDENFGGTIIEVEVDLDCEEIILGPNQAEVENYDGTDVDGIDEYDYDSGSGSSAASTIVDDDDELNSQFEPDLENVLEDQTSDSDAAVVELDLQGQNIDATNSEEMFVVSRRGSEESANPLYLQEQEDEEVVLLEAVVNISHFHIKSSVSEPTHQIQIPSSSSTHESAIPTKDDQAEDRQTEMTTKVTGTLDCKEQDDKCFIETSHATQDSNQIDAIVTGVAEVKCEEADVQVIVIDDESSTDNIDTHDEDQIVANIPTEFEGTMETDPSEEKPLLKTKADLADADTKSQEATNLESNPREPFIRTDLEEKEADLQHHEGRTSVSSSTSTGSTESEEEGSTFTGNNLCVEIGSFETISSISSIQGSSLEDENKYPDTQTVSNSGGEVPLPANSISVNEFNLDIPSQASCSIIESSVGASQCKRTVDTEEGVSTIPPKRRKEDLLEIRTENDKTEEPAVIANTSNELEERSLEIIQIENSTHELPSVESSEVVNQNQITVEVSLDETKWNEVNMIPNYPNEEIKEMETSKPEEPVPSSSRMIGMMQVDISRAEEEEENPDDHMFDDFIESCWNYRDKGFILPEMPGYRDVIPRIRKPPSPKPKILRCNECPFHSEDPDVISDHLAHHHDPEIYTLKSNEGRCDLCNYVGNEENDVKEHRTWHFFDPVREGVQGYLYRPDGHPELYYMDNGKKIVLYKPDKEHFPFPK